MARWPSRRADAGVLQPRLDRQRPEQQRGRAALAQRHVPQPDRADQPAGAVARGKGQPFGRLAAAPQLFRRLAAATRPHGAIQQRLARGDVRHGFGHYLESRRERGLFFCKFHVRDPSPAEIRSTSEPAAGSNPPADRMIWRLPGACEVPGTSRQIT